MRFNGSSVPGSEQPARPGARGGWHGGGTVPACGPVPSRARSGRPQRRPAARGGSSAGSGNADHSFATKNFGSVSQLLKLKRKQ